MENPYPAHEADPRRGRLAFLIVTTLFSGVVAIAGASSSTLPVAARFAFPIAIAVGIGWAWTRFLERQ